MNGHVCQPNAARMVGTKDRLGETSLWCDQTRKIWWIDIEEPKVQSGEAAGNTNPVELLQPDYWVIDIIYFPMETEFLRATRERGCHALSGAGMAVYQAVRAFALFTGLEPDPKWMKETFEAFEKESIL